MSKLVQELNMVVDGWMRGVHYRERERNLEILPAGRKSIRDVVQKLGLEEPQAAVEEEEEEAEEETRQTGSPQKPTGGKRK